MSDTVISTAHASATLPAKVLRDALAVVTRYTPKRPLVPVLRNTRLTVRPGHVLVEAFDYESSLRLRVPAATEGEHTALVPPSALAPVAKAARGEVMLGLNGQVTLTTDGGGTTVPTVNDYYPNLPVADEALLELPADFFSRVERVARAAGREQALPNLLGVQITMANGRLRLAATDRYRAHVHTFPEGFADVKDFEMLLPAKALVLAARSLRTSASVVLSRTVMQAAGAPAIAFLSDGECEIGMRVIDHAFPAVVRLFPTQTDTAEDNQVFLTVHTRELVSTLRSLPKARGIATRFTYSDGTLHLSLDCDSVVTTRELPATVDSGDFYRAIAVNAGYLADLLDAFDASTVQLRLSLPRKPIVVFGTDGTQAMVMPVVLHA